MKNQLVKQMDLQTITKAMIFHGGEPFATSTQIAKHFGIRHDNLIRKIEEFESFDMMTSSSKLRNLIRSYRGQDFPYYEMDADAYTFICMSFTGKKAEKFKWAFIEAFKMMAREAITARVTANVNKGHQDWLDNRTLGKDIRLMLTDSIKEFCLYAENERGGTYAPKPCPYYKHITDAVYESLELVKPATGIDRRDVFTMQELVMIEYAELEVIKLLNKIMTDGGTRKGIKDRIKAELEL